MNLGRQRIKHVLLPCCPWKTYGLVIGTLCVYVRVCVRVRVSARAHWNEKKEPDEGDGSMHPSKLYIN